MFEHNLRDNRHFFQNLLLILEYCGLWNPFVALNGSQSNTNLSKRYAIYSFVMLAVFFYLNLAAASMYIVSPNAVQKDIANAFFLSANGYRGIIKMYCFMRQRKEYGALVNEFQHSQKFRPQNEEEHIFFKRALKLSAAVFYLFYSLAVVTLCFFTVIPIYDYLHGLPLTLPFPAWYPYADTYQFFIWIAFIHQTTAVFINVNWVVALCVFEVTCFCYLNACIQTLSERLKKIGKMTTDSVPRGSNRRSKSYEDIVHLVKHHLLVKRYIQHCEELTQTSISAELIFSTLIICMASFRIVKGMDGVMELIPSVTYLGAMVFQIYLYCFVCNEITYSSNELGTSAFFSDFRKFDKQASGVFLILHKELQREIDVCSGGPLKIKLCIETFLKVIKSAYSFMAVLQAME